MSISTGSVSFPRLHLGLWALLIACASLLGCQGGGGGSPPPDAAAAPAAPESDFGPTVGDDRMVRATELSEADRKQFASTWKLFVEDRPLWPYYRDEWLRKGGAAPYVLSENLYRYFWSAAMVANETEVDRVADSAATVGEPAVAYFAKTLVLDRVPLREPVTVEIPDPEDFNARIKKTFHHFEMDDKTRQYAARVLAAIGAPAVPTLASDKVLVRARPTSRRYAAYALGRIGTPAAATALTRMLREGADWQDRANAARALGAALDRNPDVRPALLQAAQGDSDAFVRKMAARALAGSDRLDF